MPLGSMPSQLLVDDLKHLCNEYCSDKMRLYDALYEGGEKFEAEKKKFLPKRPIEKASESVGGSTHYESRLASAFYTNYAGGIIDWFSAKIVQDNPRIVVGDNVGDESREYWESLNKNADGRGNPLITLCRWAAREIIVNLRSYLSVDFPADDATNGRICLFDAVTVDDWDSDDEGNIDWIRRHTQELIRDSAAPWKAPQLEAHYWTFFDSEKIVVYRAEKKIIDRDFNKGAVAEKIEEKYHDFGMPVFDIRSDKSLWIMDRIKEPVVKLFQREASLNFYLDSLCYQMPYLVLNDTNKFSKLPVTPLGALVLEVGESVGFLTPNPGGFEPNFKAVEQCKKSFYESLQILAKEAAALPQAGRLSGEAIGAMQRPMEVLIGSFAWPIQDALVRLIDQLKIHRREEDADIRVEGFGAIEADEEELREIVMGEGNGRGKEEGQASEDSTGDGPGEGNGFGRNQEEVD